MGDYLDMIALCLKKYVYYNPPYDLGLRGVSKFSSSHRAPTLANTSAHHCLKSNKAANMFLKISNISTFIKYI